MCEKCGGAEYVSIEKPGGGYVVQPCSICKPSSYKRWLKKQGALSTPVLEYHDPLTIEQNESVDAIFIGALATKKALAALNNSRFEVSIMGLINDSIKLAEDELKRTLSVWPRPILETTIKAILIQERDILEKRDAPPIVAGPMRKRMY